jgi:hypothetical protein
MAITIGGAPRLPLVPTTAPGVDANQVAATLDSVDSLTAPKIANFIVDGQLPAISGFTWNNSLQVTIAMAPVVPAAPPTGTVYYNNSTTHEGGTIFYVDVASRTIISTTSNFSTLAGVNFSNLFQDIVHNGAYNSTGQFQNPNPLDSTSLLGNPSPTTAPVLVPPLPPSYGFTYVGANGTISTGGAYDAEIGFNTLVTNPAWLQELRLYVSANGTKADNVANIDGYYAHAATISPNALGEYTAIFHGLVAGVPYDLYVAFVDLKGVVSYGRYLETTAANPIQINIGNVLTMGNPSLVTPVVISHGTDSVEDGQAGATAFDYLIPTVTLDSVGYGTTPWLFEIELMYRNHQNLNNVMYANTLAVQAVGSTYQFIYPQLPVGINADGSLIQYDLGVRYVDQSGQRSNTLFFDAVGAATLQVGSPTLQTIPAGTTFSVNFSGLTQAAATNNGGGTFAQPLLFNLVINSSVPYVQWLDKIQLLAKEQPSAVADSDTNPSDYIKVGQITGSTYTNPLSQSFGPLGNNSIWQLAIQLVDHSGIFTNALPIFLCGVQYTAPGNSPGSSNVNFIADSNMEFTYTPGGAVASNYWTYANLDPTRFRVVGGNTTGNMLDADTHAGAVIGSVCAYTGAVQVIAGVSYTLSCNTGLTGTGSQMMGIVAASDEAANNATPSSVYASMACPNNGGAVQTFIQFTWLSTFTGPIYLAFWATSIHGACAWFHPQFEIGTVATSYKPGTAITEATATIAHGALSLPVQAVINSSAQVSVSNVQAGSRLALANTAVQVNDVVTDNGGRGVVNVAPAGGTTGTLPYTNHAVAMTQVISSTGQVNVSPTGGTSGTLPLVNHATAVTTVINSGGTYNAGTATGTLPLVNNSTAVTTVINSGGTYNAGTATGTLPYGNNSTGVTLAAGTGGSAKNAYFNYAFSSGYGGGGSYTTGAFTVNASGTWTVFVEVTTTLSANGTNNITLSSGGAATSIASLQQAIASSGGTPVSYNTVISFLCAGGSSFTVGVNGTSVCTGIVVTVNATRSVD